MYQALRKVWGTLYILHSDGIFTCKNLNLSVCNVILLHLKLMYSINLILSL